MGRKILFITTDQQRYDSLGCNGGGIARTPTVDALASAGLNYRRAYNQNTVCMPARSTMLTGQYARTHGVVANGIPRAKRYGKISSRISTTVFRRSARF
jgi:arylsulfatase A-like enzyme